jgi:hypothetical protein
MTKKWTDAGGDHQMRFMGAASKTLDGVTSIVCPKCKEADLRSYFHAFKPDGKGTVWVWCPRCRTTAHLPRVTRDKYKGSDPFAALTRDQFEELERSKEPLLDRLDRLWDEGKIGPPAT